MSHDLRFALRQFRRAPGLTSAALMALTLGIGGMATVFTLIDAVVLRPLPVSAPGTLVWLRDPSFSYPMFEQMRDRAHMLTGVFAWEPRTLQAEWTSEPEPTSMVLVTGAFHTTLGLQPAAGRLITQADVGNTTAEAQAVAVTGLTRSASKDDRLMDTGQPRRAGGPSSTQFRPAISRLWVRRSSAAATSQPPMARPAPALP